MATHRACPGCLDDCIPGVPAHCASCVHEAWPCDAHRRGAEVERLNRLVDTLTRAVARYQEEDEEVGGDDAVDHPYQRRGSWSCDAWCAVEGCTSRPSVHAERRTW